MKKLIIPMFLAATVILSGCSKIPFLTQILDQEPEEQIQVVHITQDQKTASEQEKTRWDALRLQYEEEKKKLTEENEPTPTPDVPTATPTPGPTQVPDEPVPDTEVKCTGQKYPDELVKGQSFYIHGQIAPEEGVITKVSGYFYDEDETLVMGVTDEVVNRTEYQIKKSKVDYGLVFGILDEGTYRCSIVAEGTRFSNKEVMGFTFTINPRPEIKKSNETENSDEE